MVENKRKLQKIAKRFAKSVIFECLDFAFTYTELTDEEQQYINGYMVEIGNKITKLPIADKAEDLVNEYYGFK